MTDSLLELWLRTGEHVILLVVSTAVALIIGLPLGILAHQKPWMRGPVVGTVGILQTIPSLAMLGLLLVLLNRIGALPALIALTLYALLPIVRNTLAGLEGLPPEAIEAARGIGMSTRQELWIVKMPLALPVIVAGIQTATIVGVAIVALVALIGAGGLGVFIFRGIAMLDHNLILLGAVPAALLAVLVYFLIEAAEWGLRPVREAEKGALKAKLKPVAVASPLVLVLVGVAGLLTGASVEAGGALTANGKENTVVVGSKNFTEQLILGELMAQLIERKTNLSVKRQFNLGGTMICHNALIRGEIDLYAEYTGTGLTAILKRQAVTDPQKALRAVRHDYRERFQVEWLQPFGFNNTYSICVRRADAERRGWKAVSDLAPAAPDLRAGFTGEFMERPDGYPGLRRTYGYAFGETHDLDPSLMYEAITRGEVDVICAFATDGRIAAYDLHLLIDDRRFFPPYHAAPLVRHEVLRKHPELGRVLSSLAELLDEGTMRRLNYEVDGKKRSPEEVAREFLIEKKLLP